MGQFLFWLEAAVTSVLFVALGLGVLSRVHRPGQRWLVRIALAGLAVLPWLAVIGAFAAVASLAGGALGPLVSSIVAGVGFAVAAAVVIKRGGRPSALGDVPAASVWRPSRLVLAWAAGLLLTCMTFWNLDLAVRQEMATLRVEAGAIAVSVAPPRVPASQNAAVQYRQAWEVLDAQKTAAGGWNEAVGQWLHPGTGEFDPNDARMLEFVGRQGPVIDLLCRAAALPGCDFGTNYNPPSVETVLPALGKMRGLSRLLCLSARVAAHQGRTADAMRDVSATLALADHCTTEPALVALLVSLAAEDQAFETFQYVLNQASPAREGIDAMHVDNAGSFGAALHRSMRMETAFGMSFFTMPDPSPALSALGIPGTRNYAVAGGAAPYRVFLWGQDVAAYLRCMRRYEELSAGAYYETVHEWRKLVRQPESKNMGGLLASLLVPSLSLIGERAAKAEAQHRLIALGVAMWKYRLAEGSFPAELERLMPKYLLTVPADPFTGKGMKLARTDAGAVVYSVGPDLSDDGGKATDRKTTKGDVLLILGR
jgi:hypothetical protein